MKKTQYGFSEVREFEDTINIFHTGKPNEELDSNLSQMGYASVEELKQTYPDFHENVVNDSYFIFFRKPVPLQEEENINFDVDLALILANHVHIHCNDVPHDIGIQLAQLVKEHQNKK